MSDVDLKRVRHFHDAMMGQGVNIAFHHNCATVVEDAEKEIATLRADLAAVRGERDEALNHERVTSGLLKASGEANELLRAELEKRTAERDAYRQQYSASEVAEVARGWKLAAEERDRMRPVVDAAVKLSHHHGAMVTLSDAVDDYLDSGGAVESTRCRACDGDLPDCRCKSLRTEGATAERARRHLARATHDARRSERLSQEREAASGGVMNVDECYAWLAAKKRRAVDPIIERMVQRLVDEGCVVWMPRQRVASSYQRGRTRRFAKVIGPRRYERGDWRPKPDGSEKG